VQSSFEAENKSIIEENKDRPLFLRGDFLIISRMQNRFSRLKIVDSEG
jgi:hypothetical protein